MPGICPPLDPLFPAPTAPFAAGATQASAEIAASGGHRRFRRHLAGVLGCRTRSTRWQPASPHRLLAVYPGRLPIIRWCREVTFTQDRCHARSHPRLEMRVEYPQKAVGRPIEPAIPRSPTRLLPVCRAWSQWLGPLRPPDGLAVKHSEANWLGSGGYSCSIQPGLVPFWLALPWGRLRSQPRFRRPSAQRWPRLTDCSTAARWWT